jgi:hypothetical protein
VREWGKRGKRRKDVGLRSDSVVSMAVLSWKSKYGQRWLLSGYCSGRQLCIDVAWGGSWIEIMVKFVWVVVMKWKTVARWVD